ncbi:2-octaprenylphenol hydroxylase [Methylophilaceae bacterium]|nr:2-octaprenylphenol hydroxylase [Methylophilaceae bacterium]
MVNAVHQQYDAIVLGGGLVGASCALALSKAGYAVALLESHYKPADSSAGTDETTWDSRIYAITPSNQAWLDRLGVWQKLNPERICDIARMQVCGDAQDSQLVFNADDAHIRSLGAIVESGELQQSLWHELLDSDVTLVTETEAVARIAGKQSTQLTMSDGAVLEAALVVGADGANSWLRAQAGIPLSTHDYGQMGVVANFETTLPHHHTAWQWFKRDDGILAWLPMPGNRMSMVWSAPDRIARGLLELNADALSEKVAEAGGYILGDLRNITAARAFPLVQRTAQHLVKPGMVLVGDAAHTVHPLAGQGVNLGFRDVQALLDVLMQGKKRQHIGDYRLLRAYERARKTDIVAMQTLTRGLAELFGMEHSMMKKLRNWGLGFTDRQHMLKKFLMHQAIR